MTQNQKARKFAALHVKAAPLILYNAWDAGSAKAIVLGGAGAIATSSWAVAEAQGYRDGEAMPLELAVTVIGRITATIDVPVTADFEGGYSEDDEELSQNVSRLLSLGVVGINFEDRVVNGAGLYDIDRQSRRIGVIRETARRHNLDLFINARTDLFLGQARGETQVVGEALERARAYAAAGASGLFVPGLTSENSIAEICSAAPLPVNVMMMEGLPPIAVLVARGVSRISYGPVPYMRAMEFLSGEARTALSSR